ncbi:MAG: SDR family NAD(P)-dependent oxidoreductase [Acidobacteria bacterium]|nr:SDR family NAD(P)-dependent oxidoreductase [Acidobacteriota bacterium]MCZ6662052.1 SDR family NAD(P)-dependent oxidoreductase [Actinomycetota bacterium]
MEVNNSVAVVTGGASGLGFATAQRLAANGASVVLVDLNDEAGVEAASKIGTNSRFIQCDVRNPGAVESAITGAYETFGRIDVLVNAAGVGTAGRVVGRDGSLFDLDLFKFTIDVNLIGMFDVLRHVAGRMAGNEPNSAGERGVIVNVASIAAFEGQVGQAAYSASKGGVVGMTLPIARELADLGIRVMAVAPGVFATNILSMLPDKAITELENRSVFPKRLGDPEEFAQLVQSIVENPYLNGETIRIDAATRLPPR